jgi:hypothetical protein
MVHAGSFFNSSGLGGLARFFLGKMFQGKSLQHDEKNGAF